MRKSSNFSRNPSNRIEEEAEGYDYSTSSSEDYEDQLIPAPVIQQRTTSSAATSGSSTALPRASSNLFDAELDNTKDAAELNGGGSDAEFVDGGLGEEDMMDEDVDKDESIRERIAQSQEQMKHILEFLSEDQLKRYETFRRVGFPRQAIRKLMTKVLDQQVNMNSVIVVSGIAKVFVGELIEEARRIRDDLGETGPILPSHLIEAQRRLKVTKLAPSSSIYKRRRNRLL